MIRKPDIVIGESYLSRWYVIPRNRFFNVYLHKFIGSDDDRALHDHPWWSVSFLLKGRLKEHTREEVRFIPRYWPVFRSATFAHRLEVTQGPVWTLFITGSNVRPWGFHCPKGWVPWQYFTTADGKNIDRGCE